MEETVLIYTEIHENRVRLTCNVIIFRFGVLQLSSWNFMQIFLSGAFDRRFRHCDMFMHIQFVHSHLKNTNFNGCLGMG
jgi:hypothetical protein